jgi:hypothetical protein
MCLLFPLAGFTESGGSITKGSSERRTFEPLSIVVRTLVLQSLGTIRDFHSIDGETSYIGISVVGGLHGWWIDVE